MDVLFVLTAECNACLCVACSACITKIRLDGTIRKAQRVEQACCSSPNAQTVCASIAVAAGISISRLLAAVWLCCCACRYIMNHTCCFFSIKLCTACIIARRTIPKPKWNKHVAAAQTPRPCRHLSHCGHLIREVCDRRVCPSTCLKRRQQPPGLPLGFDVLNDPQVPSCCFRIILLLLQRAAVTTHHAENNGEKIEVTADVVTLRVVLLNMPQIPIAYGRDRRRSRFRSDGAGTI